ncbi:MAG: EutN/CcmL family microcompartment protein [Bacteriovoracaceae bacterium]|nr:EutN/CcmL family microcompartment protein [Bacteriovoracaceae bacterium]
MKLCRVKGNVTSTMKHKSFKGHKCLICQPIDENGNDIGEPVLSFDSVSAGAGDVVLVQQEGNCARQLLGTPDDPFHSVIIGIVDRVDIMDKKISEE